MLASEMFGGIPMHLDMPEGAEGHPLLRYMMPDISPPAEDLSKTQTKDIPSQHQRASKARKLDVLGGKLPPPSLLPLLRDHSYLHGVRPAFFLIHARLPSMHAVHTTRLP